MNRRFVRPILFRFLLLPALAILLITGTGTGQAQLRILTYHGNNARTGQNPSETILTPANVNKTNFGKLFSQPVDGQMYAEPLYVGGVILGSLKRNVVYVATEHDSVYAFDADSATGASAAPLWQVNFTHAAAGVTTIPNADAGTKMIAPEIGITSTPVIDASTRTLFVVAATKENGSYFQRLHALDISSGAEKFGGPIVIQASVPGTGKDAVNGVVSFDALRQLQRAALLLLNGVVYIASASHGLEKQIPYHGWVIGYNAKTLAQVSVFNTSPNGTQSGIWLAGGGPAADGLGGIYVSTGNGPFDANTGGSGYGSSVIRLNGSNLTVSDYFTPFDQANLTALDLDLGSGGPIVLPFQSGTLHPHLLAAAGKNSTIYLLDRKNMGKFNSTDNSQIVQSIPNAFGGHELMGTPAYFQNKVYFWAENDVLRVFQLTNGLLSTTPIVTSVRGFSAGATPVITANGTTNGILWALQVDQWNRAGAAVLHAFDANTAAELYGSNQSGTRDTAGPAVKFAVPTVVNGKVYVGTSTELDVYGLLP